MTNAKAADTINSLSGESRIIGADGTERIAHLGDKVFLRDMILTSSNAVMQLQLEDGQLFDLEADGRYALGNGDGAIWVAQAGSAAGGIVSAPNVIPAGGKPVGTISVVIGDVKIVGVDGVVRVAKVGDAVYMKEVIETGADGIIQIKLADGRTLDVGRDSKLALEADLLAFDPALAAAPPPVADPAAATTDVAALQAQIAAGADPTQVAAATAAGGAPGAGGGLDGSGGDPVVVDQANTSGPVNSGFNSEGAGIQFPTVEPQLLPEIQSTVSVVVEVAVDVPVDPDNPPTDAVFLSPDGPAIVEGTNGENKVVTFVIKLDKPFAVDVEVTYQITPGTAEPGSDYTGVLTATVTIPAGATEVPVPVEIIQDHFVEGNETFNIVLVDAVNATINPAQSTASIIIVDDDRLPVANPDTNWTQEDLSVSASGNVLIDDDTPEAEVESATAAAVLLDESPVAPDGDGIVSATGDFSVNFGTPAFGADGAGSVSYALALTGTDVASGLFVLDPNAVDGKGDEIVLNQSGKIITGSAGSTDYFSIEVDPDTGIVTFTRLANIWHDNASDHDDVETLTLANANLLQLVQTVTDADGDSDEAAINLGTGVFQIEDDGPSIGADNIAIANVAETYSGTYTFDVGTDVQAFENSFASGSLVLTGTSEGNPDTLTISSSDLGVSDNVMHGNKDDVLRFDIVPVGGFNSTISTLTIHVATTAGWKATDSVNWTVHYTTGPDQMLTEIWGEDQQVTFNFDENRTVDWVEITPNGNDSFKIDGVSLSYTTQEFPDDYQLNFQLTGSDGDQDIATAEFTIAVNTTDTLTYHIDGTSGNDQVYGTTGNDIIAGGAGDDILTGGAADDTFRRLSGDKGAGTPAVDAITDWVTGHNKLDLADLLQGENAGNLNVFLMFEQTGSDVTLSVSSQGDGNVDQVIVLQNVTMADLAGANPDTSAGVIANLLDQSKLLIS